MPTQVSIGDVTVNLENGLHLGPSSQIVQLVQRFDCELRIRKEDRVVNGGSMLDLLTLAAEHGTKLHLEARGQQAHEAMEAIVALFERNFAVEESVENGGARRTAD